MFKNCKSKKLIFVWIAVITMLIGSMGAYFIQTNGGKVDVLDLSIETDSGIVSMLMFRPNNYKYETSQKNDDGTVSVQTNYYQLPCVICVHGNLNSREMQDYAYIELARRGCLVIAIDMFGHGHSSPENPGPDIQAAIDYVSNLSYVDPTKIGLTGHSLGAVQIQTVATANPDKISAVLPVGWSLIPNVAAALPDASLGSIVGAYDEFFYYLNMCDSDGNLKIDESGQILYPTVEAYNYANMQEVMNVSGIHENTFEFNTYYQTPNNKLRIVYQENKNHPLLVYCKKSSEYIVEFFENAWNLDFEATTGISNTDIIWGWKAFFNTLGLAGFFAFIIAFALWMLELPFFSKLKIKSEAICEDRIKPSGFKETLIYIIPLAAMVILSGVLYYPLMRCGLFFEFEGTNSYNTTFPYQYANYSMTWAFIMGFISIAVFAIGFIAQRKGQTLQNKGFKNTLKQLGLVISPLNLLRSIILAVAVIFSAYVLVYVFDYFFKTDFRFYTLAVKTFSPTVLVYTFVYFIFYFVYYFANAVTSNANARKGFPEWLNIVIMCAVNVLGLLLVLAAYYIPFFMNGIPAFYESINPVLLYPFIILLCITPIYARKLYKATGNVYIPAILNTLLVTIITLASTRYFI